MKKKDINIKIDHRISEDVFVLFSALNAMGYNDENNPKGMLPLRKKARKYLLKKNLANKYPELKKIIKNYHQYALLFKVVSLNKKINAAGVNSFGQIFKELTKDLSINELWKIIKSKQLKETKKLFPSFKKEIFEILKFLKRCELPVNKFILIFNPLDAYWRGYSIKIKNVCYIIVGPGATKNNNELIRHELLHVLAPNFRIPKNILITSKALNKQGYGDKKIISREYIIRALNLIYKNKVLKKNIQKNIEQERKNFPYVKNIIKIIKERLKK